MKRLSWTRRTDLIVGWVENIPIDLLAGANRLPIWTVKKPQDDLVLLMENKE
jgi:hypothetical protein